MSVLKHLKTLQHVSIFSDHLQEARRFLVKVQHTSPRRAPRTHTTCYAAASPRITFTILKTLKL